MRMVDAFAKVFEELTNGQDRQFDSGSSFDDEYGRVIDEHVDDLPFDFDYITARSYAERHGWLEVTQDRRVLVHPPRRAVA